MKNRNLLTYLFVLICCARDVTPCRHTDEDSRKLTTVASVITPLPVPARFNCTAMDQTKPNETTIKVRNISNINETFCTVVINITDINRMPELVGACNYLGNSVCPNCSSNPTYSAMVNRITIYCWREAATTPTTEFASTEGERSTGEREQQGRDSNPQREGYRTIEIVGISLGIAALTVIVAVVLACFKRKCRSGKKDAPKTTQNPSDVITRTQTTENGDIYTVVNKERLNNVKNTPSEDTKIMSETRVPENGDLYTVVNKGKPKDINNAVIENTTEDSAAMTSSSTDNAYQYEMAESISGANRINLELSGDIYNNAGGINRAGCSDDGNIVYNTLFET